MGELIDLVNDKGEVVVVGVDRDDFVPRPGLFMRIVIGVITNPAGEVLVHQRAFEPHKTVDPGCIDHVCGGVLSGEDPEAAATRESGEEVGVDVKSWSRVDAGVNVYGRFRVLLAAVTDQLPSNNLDPTEVVFAGFFPRNELVDKEASGEFTFVKEFFEDLDRATRPPD